MSKKQGKKGGQCPCDSGLLFDTCCGRYLSGSPAPTPEALMRSRYTAYATGNYDYVLSTWAEETRPAVLFEVGEARPKWICLEILSADEEGDIGHVHFVARARTSAGVIKLEEKSRFRREKDARWLYVDGDLS